jgi:hypothetical protein
MTWHFRRPRPEFTEAELLLMAELYGQQGVAAKKIAKLVGHESPRILAALRARGIVRKTRPTFTPEQLGEMRRLYDPGHWTTTELAARYGRNSSTVNRALRAMGVAIRPCCLVPARELTPAQRNEMAMLYEDYAWSTRRLSLRYGVGIPRIEQCLIALGVAFRAQRKRPKPFVQPYQWQWYGDPDLQRRLRQYRRAA